MGRRHRLQRKIARAGTSSSGSHLEEIINKDYSNSVTLTDLQNGVSLNEIEKKAKMSASKRRKFEKFVVAANIKKERTALIESLSKKVFQFPALLRSSKTIGNAPRSRLKAPIKQELIEREAYLHA